jgi:hypothetical protein
MSLLPLLQLPLLQQWPLCQPSWSTHQLAAALLRMLQVQQMQQMQQAAVTVLQMVQVQETGSAVLLLWKAVLPRRPCHLQLSQLCVLQVPQQRPQPHTPLVLSQLLAQAAARPRPCLPLLASALRTSSTPPRRT